MIRSSELTPLLKLQGVRGVAWVDDDGSIILQAGYIPELLAPHATQLLSRWQEFSSGENSGWREVHVAGWKLMIRGCSKGYLCLLTDEDANLGRIRLATGEMMVHLDHLVKEPDGSRDPEVGGR